MAAGTFERKVFRASGRAIKFSKNVAVNFTIPFDKIDNKFPSF